MINSSITILGAGAWGTAIAHLLATNGHDVILWCHEPELAQEINEFHTNSFFLPNVDLPHSVKATASIGEAITCADIIFEAVPVKYLREILDHAQPFINKDQLFVVLSKGMEQDTFLVPTQIIDDQLCTKMKKAVVCGPSFARDLVDGVPTGVVVASDNHEVAKKVSKLLCNNYFSCHLSDDIFGVQLCAALKNVFALSMGIAFGAQARDNTVALFLTKALFEMAQVVDVLGGKRETVYGLAGIGDLVLTCYGSLSKNFTLGKLLGQGNLLSDIASDGIFPEGINTIQSLIKLSEKMNLSLPMVQGAYNFIFCGSSFGKVLESVQEH